MTQEQYTYLQGYLGSLRKFADAIARVLINSNDNVVAALDDLRAGLNAPKARKKATGGRRVVPAAIVGCCTYDTNLQSDGITQTYCEGGLQGYWSSNPCPRIEEAHGKRSRPSLKK
jgi:hypothetical protein